MDGKIYGFLWIPNVVPKLYCMLPVEATSFKCLIKSYGEISHSHLKTWEHSYFGLMERRAQDSAALGKFLINSLSNTGKNKIQVYSDQYTVNRMVSGALL